MRGKKAYNYSNFNVYTQSSFISPLFRNITPTQSLHPIYNTVYYTYTSHTSSHSPTHSPITSLLITLTLSHDQPLIINHIYYTSHSLHPRSYPSMHLLSPYYLHHTHTAYTLITSPLSHHAYTVTLSPFSIISHICIIIRFTFYQSSSLVTHSSHTLVTTTYPLPLHPANPSITAYYSITYIHYAPYMCSYSFHLLLFVSLIKLILIISIQHTNTK